jgi:hypothetical protein
MTKLKLETRSKYIAMGLSTCVHCNGGGVVEDEPCSCVDRSIFRAVMNRFREYAAGAHLLRPLSLRSENNPRGRKVVGRKQEEYLADVALVARRTLTDPTESSVFRFRYLLGADWKLCTQKLGITRGNYFHACYRVEAKLGRAFLELRPYALYPLDEYFRGSSKVVDIRPLPAFEEPQRRKPLRPPLAPRVAPLVPFLVPVAARPAPSERELPATPLHSEIAVMEQIREWFTTGRSTRAIAANLNSLTVTPIGRGTTWYPSTVKKLLMIGVYKPRAA